MTAEQEFEEWWQDNVVTQTPFRMWTEKTLCRMVYLAGREAQRKEDTIQ